MSEFLTTRFYRLEAYWIFQEFWMLLPWKLTCPLKNSKECSKTTVLVKWPPFFGFLEVYNAVTNHWSPIPGTKASPAATPRGEGRSTRQCLRAGRCPNDGVQACWYQPGILVKLRPPKLTPFVLKQVVCLVDDVAECLLLCPLAT